MKRRMIILALALALIFGTAVYLWYSHPATGLSIASTLTPQTYDTKSQLEDSAKTTSEVKPTQRQTPVPPPPPPPFPGNEPTTLVAEPSSEPSRTLIGVTSEYLSQIEQYLPEGSRIYTYPEGNLYRRAALVDSDLDGNNVAETIIIHTEKQPTAKEPTPTLVLSILSRAGDALSVSQSVPLIGGVLFNVNVDGLISPLAVRDVTGDGRPEILVASGVGASLGGYLQIFTIGGLTIRQLARIGGHFFNVRSGNQNRSTMINARWKEEETTKNYKWNGQEFEEVR